jgi:16S rRNA (cytosine1402-N4)-methyltransferase
MSATRPPAKPGGHQPVMLREVLDALSPRDGGIYVDGTFGAGGYSAGILAAADCRVFGIDRDPEVADRAAALSRRHAGRLTFVPGRFGEMDRLLRARGIELVDGVAFDLGVSSMQIDDAARGFAFSADGPLDMRMEMTGPSAADVVNRQSERALSDILFHYGEERRARRVARAIVDARAQSPITRTRQLADIVRRAVGGRRGGIDPATRSFMALRIYVNDELGEIDRGLAAAEAILAPGGRLAVVTFHSLEDRRVKQFLNVRSRAGHGSPVIRASRHLPASDRDTPAPSFHMLFRRALPPGVDEVTSNPRARSARLRAAERTAAPAWPREAAP